MTISIPFDVSFHFDDDLREVPNNPTEMQQALKFLQSQLKDNAIEIKSQIQLLGLIGVYSRILKDFAVAQQALTSAVELSELVGSKQLRTANMIRLAHVYQWQKDYAISEQLLYETIALCQCDSDLTFYLDFAYQHMGKCKFDRHQYEAARGFFEQALSLRNSKGDRSSIESTQFALDAVNRRSLSAG